MIIETHKGRKIRITKGAARGESKVTIDGIHMGDVAGTPEHALHVAKGTIDHLEERAAKSAPAPAADTAPATEETALVPAEAPKPTMLGRLRPGVAKTARIGRAARTTPGVTTTRAHRANVLAVLIARINQGKILVRDYLIGVGLDAEFVARYEGAFGNVAKKLYQQATGQAPQRTGVAMVRGWRRQAYAYQAEHLGILFAALRTYPRTAALVAKIGA